MDIRHAKYDGARRLDAVCLVRPSHHTKSEVHAHTDPEVQLGFTTTVYPLSCGERQLTIQWTSRHRPRCSCPPVIWTLYHNCRNCKGTRRHWVLSFMGPGRYQLFALLSSPSGLGNYAHSKPCRLLSDKGQVWLRRWPRAYLPPCI